MRVCKRCNQKKPESEFYPDRKYKDGLQAVCKSCHLAIKAEHRKKCKEIGVMNYSQRTRQRLRLEIIKHYGGENPCCACCGKSHIEFLAIDHVSGGGAKHRRLLGGGLYIWLKRNNFPSGYRVLCHNCNQSLGAYGYCPHQNPNARPYCPPKRIYKNPCGRKSKKKIPLNFKSVKFQTVPLFIQ